MIYSLVTSNNWCRCELTDASDEHFALLHIVWEHTVLCIVLANQLLCLLLDGNMPLMIIYYSVTLYVCVLCYHNLFILMKKGRSCGYVHAYYVVDHVTDERFWRN